MTTLIGNILNLFVESKERSMRMADLHSKLILSSTPTDLVELNKTVQRLKPLLSFSYIGMELAISVDIKVDIIFSLFLLLLLLKGRYNSIKLLFRLINLVSALFFLQLAQRLPYTRRLSVFACLRKEIEGNERLQRQLLTKTPVRHGRD